MNATERLLLIEQARAEFERNVKAALGTDAISVKVDVYTAANMLNDAPQEWERDVAGKLTWARSCFMGVSVFGNVEA